MTFNVALEIQTIFYGKNKNCQVLGFEGDWTFVMYKLHDNLNRKSKRTKSQTIKTAVWQYTAI